MYSTPLRQFLFRRPKSPGVAARLISTAPTRVKIGKASSFGGLEIRASKTKHTHPLTSGIDARSLFFRSWSPIGEEYVGEDGNQDKVYAFAVKTPIRGLLPANPESNRPRRDQVPDRDRKVPQP